MELTEFREDLLQSVDLKADEYSVPENEAFVFEIGERLSDAEEFQDFLPCFHIGAGARNKSLKVDGYEYDEIDNSVRLLISDFSGKEDLETITKTRVESIFGQLKAFVEFSTEGRLSEEFTGRHDLSEVKTLADLLRDTKSIIGRYRLYLITDQLMSDRIKDLPEEVINGITTEFHVWDINRLFNVTRSSLGIEELEIDFTEFVSNGLLCLPSSTGEDFDSYLAVVPGDLLADLYDKYGSRLLEGNVRAFLSPNTKINKPIQATIRAEPQKFFIYNNGISTTATGVTLVDSVDGVRLCKAKYFQIVNGGQTTASLYVAKKKDSADLSGVNVQMKLTVVKAADKEILSEMIQKIAKFSNKQNTVSDSDFFSNHPFHTGYERLSRNVPAPASAGNQYNTFWFYERAKGQYLNEQSRMTVGQKKAYQLKNPKSQLIKKTDLAKSENSWRQFPHLVSMAAQKNFSGNYAGAFSKYIDEEWGESGAKFLNEGFYKDSIARIIVFKFLEKLVSSADWYQGGHRAQIVTYSIAKLSQEIKEQAMGADIDFRKIWSTQGVTIALSRQLEKVAQEISVLINQTPVPNGDVGEWCKKFDCWTKIKNHSIILNKLFLDELIDKDSVANLRVQNRREGLEDASINAVIEVVALSKKYWSDLLSWSKNYEPIYGRNATLLNSAATRLGSWIPTDNQAKELLKIKDQMQKSGYLAK
jgi:hypothetical protein